MSDYITFEIQEEIIKRLPVKSVIRFRSVSKAWKGLIDSPKFIASYCVCHTDTRLHHLLITYIDTPDFLNKYVCFVDDDTFPQQKFSPTLPFSITQLLISRIVGSSGGLLCFYGNYICLDCRKEMAVLWNPSIRKSVAIDVPIMKAVSYETFLGFGVCPVTSDPMIVKITQSQIWCQTLVPWTIEVYTLSSGEWRTPSCNLPHHSIHVTWDQVVIDRFIYWLAFETIAINDRFLTSHMIMSFDMTTDELRQVYLPDSLSYSGDLLDFATPVVRMSKVRESLVVLEYSRCDDNSICDVWMMEYGVPKSFTKLFTIKSPHASITTLGFRKNGEPIINGLEDWGDCFAETELAAYEPYSEHINNLGIFGESDLFYVNSYMETLLLLNHID